jgi:hypothetical protein
MGDDTRQRTGSGRCAVGVALVLAALLAGLDAEAAGGTDVVTAAGFCASCHPTEAADAAASGGHAPTLDCISCHADAHPGRFGPGHRRVARCASCHAAEVGHPPRRRPRRGRRAQRNCLRCHVPHGSPNIENVRTAIRRRHRLVPVAFLNASGAAPGGFTNPDAPGTGICEVCHRRTQFYRGDGTGAEHFTAPCTACHQHATGFEPVASDTNCAICHTDEGTRFEKPSGHSAALACSDCHAELSTVIGPGHRAVPACTDCHDAVHVATHAPMGPPGIPCETCHEPHGTDNIALIREEIALPQGGTAPIVFTAIAGREDGGLAGASVPGSGLCEVCHTTTSHYRADGTGDPHYTLPCVPCHLHADGFNPG